jgi:protein-disulfide isomerase
MIRRDFVDQGKLTYVSFAFPLERIHPHARKASEAAECAAQQGRYWEMHERLFDDEAALQEPDVFMKNATALGLDMARFESCLASEAANAVATDVAEGERLHVNATPTFFLGTIQSDGAIELVKRISGAAPLEVFGSAIEDVAQNK